MTLILNIWKLMW